MIIRDTANVTMVPLEVRCGRKVVDAYWMRDAGGEAEVLDTKWYTFLLKALHISTLSSKGGKFPEKEFITGLVEEETIMKRGMT